MHSVSDDGHGVHKALYKRIQTIIIHTLGIDCLNLVVHRRSRTADLQLNGKFFKRYDLTAPVKGRDGAYEIPSPARQLWAQIGAVFSVKDRNEIEMLMPKGASVLISEF